MPHTPPRHPMRHRPNVVIGQVRSTDEVGLEPRIMVQVSANDRAFIDEMRRLSYQLAVERGHVRR